MQFINLKILSLILALNLSSVLVLAEEHGAPKEGSESSEPAKEGEGEKKSAGSQSDREWAKRTTSIQKYSAKIEETTKELQSLIREKEHAPVEELEKIQVKFKELKEIISKYNAEKEELKYRYPEEGALIERKYLPMKDRALEELSNDTNFGLELKKTKKKIDKKYATFTGNDSRPKKEEKPLSEPSTDKKNEHEDEEAGPKRLMLSK
jgi:DNA repair ATPase RecN